jgi:transcriptional regulator with XRE-family HTH domain
MRFYDFGTRIKQLRKARKLTQSQMGEILDLHYTQVARLEKGQSTPSTLTLVNATRRLKVNLDWLVFGDSAQTHIGDTELLYLFKQLLSLRPADRIDVKTMLGNFIRDRKPTI